MEIKRLLKRLFECDTWVCRLSLYLVIYIAVILISHLVILISPLVFSNIDLSHTDVDSARYMLSALIQSEAAIIAIVITMSLVAAQLAASSYSVRVIDIFRNAPDLWILLLIYGFVIFWGLGVLKLIDTADPLACASDLICQSNLQGHIALTYSLGIFAFVALAPYMWNIFGMLNASTITANCAKNITKKSILKSITTKNPTYNDSFLTIVDIIKSSLVKYDYGTFKIGLRAIGYRINHIFENEIFEGKEEMEISNHLFAHLTRIGRLAVHMGDEYSTYEVINTLSNIGEIVTQKQLPHATYSVMNNLKDIGVHSTNKNLEWPTDAAADSLANIGDTKSYLFNWNDMPGNDNGKLVEFLKPILKVNWVESASITKNSAGNTIRLCFEKEAISLTLNDEQTKLNLQIDNGEIDEIIVLGNDGLIYRPLNFKVRGMPIEFFESSYLKTIGKKAVDRGLESTANYVVQSLGRVGERAVMKDLPNMVSKTNIAFKEIGMCAIDSNHVVVVDAIKECIRSINSTIYYTCQDENSWLKYKKVLDSSEELLVKLEKASTTLKNKDNFLDKSTP